MAGRWLRTPGLCLLAALLCGLASPSTAQVGRRLARREDAVIPGNKFQARIAHKDSGIGPPQANTPWEVCDFDLTLKWHVDLSSGVYATPLITDLFADGRKEVIVPTLEHALTVLEGPSGARAPEFEAPHASTLHGSPVLLDIDGDGVQNVVIATYNAELFFFQDNGAQAAPFMTIPRLRVPRRWYQQGSGSVASPSPAGTVAGSSRRLLLETEEGSHAHTAQRTALETGSDPGGGGGEGRVRRVLEEQPDPVEGAAQGSQRLTAEGAASFGELFGEDAGAFLSVDADGARAVGWGDDAFREAAHGADPSGADTLALDAHVLATPAVGDVLSTGQDIVVAAVSYFFDAAYYESAAARAELGAEVELDAYAATGVVALDARGRRVVWTSHLDLSRGPGGVGEYAARASGSPVLADVDGDGRLEVVLATGTGAVYVLEGSSGKPLPGWPVVVGPVRGPVAVADVDGDGRVELVVGDALGSLVVLRGDGSEVWERHLGSALNYGVMLGDVNSDGRLDIVAATVSGEVHVLAAGDGSSLPGWPYLTRGSIAAPPLLTSLRPGPYGLTSPAQGLQVVLPAADGFLYVIDGARRCAASLDLGERSHGRVLVDDLDGDGLLDLVVAGRSGGVYAIASRAGYHAARVWSGDPPGGRLVAGLGWTHLVASPFTRRPRDVRARELVLRVTLVDGWEKSRGRAVGGPYTITARLLNAAGGLDPTPGAVHTLLAAPPLVVNASGSYTLRLPCPVARTTGLVSLTAVDRHGVVYSDVYAQSFHIHFYKLLKWMVALPAVATAAVILLTPREIINRLLPV